LANGEGPGVEQEVDMLIGYNTNGLANHDGLQAIELLSEIGFRAIGITVDHQLLSPAQPRLLEQRRAVGRVLRENGLRSTIETGARYLLDPRIKHHPTLLSISPADRHRRRDYLSYCLELAAELGSDCLSLWSGAKPAEWSDQQALDTLADELGRVLELAGNFRVEVAFEPEPGMFIDTLASFARLKQWMHRDELRLTLDVGHLYCQGEVPLADYIHRWGAAIRNVHIEDMKAGVHEHLMFGEGDIRFPPVIQALRDVDYQGGVYIELSRHSHDGPNAARQAFEFLQPLIAGSGGD
jgi:sugar phosphate isomerase/epimerase